MFRKFLFFTICLMTLASQDGYGAITLGTPKAILQRGNFQKITLNFTLDNIAPEDLQSYEMGTGDTAQEGIRSIVRYLDICVNNATGTKCTAGPNPRKVPYQTYSEYDSTPSDQRYPTEYAASFPDNSPVFSKLESDTTRTYRRLTVSILLTASDATPFSKDTTYIAIRLLRGTATSSSNEQDQEVKPTIAVAASEVVQSFAVVPSKSRLTGTWDEDEQLSRDDATKAPPDGAIAFVVKQEDWSKRNIPVSSYDGDDINSEVAIPNACIIVPDSEDDAETECSVECETPGVTDYYLKYDELNKAGFTVAESGNTGSISISDLDNNTTYAFILQNQPDGLKRACKIAKPSDAVMLTELGGGPAPKVKDPRCFIATAAYGSSLDPHLHTLRWFRDNVLLVTTLGQKFVSLYYSYSPPVADFIASHPSLRTITRGALWLPVIVIEFWRERPSLLLTLSAMCGTFLLLFLRRRSLRASV